MTRCARQQWRVGGAHRLFLLSRHRRSGCGYVGSLLSHGRSGWAWRLDGDRRRRWWADGVLCRRGGEEVGSAAAAASVHVRGGSVSQIGDGDIKAYRHGPFWLSTVSRQKYAVLLLRDAPAKATHAPCANICFCWATRPTYARRGLRQWYETAAWWENDGETGSARYKICFYLMMGGIVRRRRADIGGALWASHVFLRRRLAHVARRGGGSLRTALTGAAKRILLRGR